MKLVVYMKSKEEIVFESVLFTAANPDFSLLLVVSEEHGIVKIPMCDIERYDAYDGDRCIFGQVNRQGNQFRTDISAKPMRGVNGYNIHYDHDGNGVSFEWQGKTNDITGSN